MNESVPRDQSETFDTSLRNQQAIKWVAMNGR